MIVRTIKKSEFARHVGTLATGTVLAQAIIIGVYPILTRIYSPENYAALALFAAIAYSLAPGISGRYDLAMVVQKEDADRRLLLALSFYVAIPFCLTIMIVLVIFQDFFSSFLNATSLGFWLLLAPVALLISASDTIFRRYATTQKDYALLGKTAVLHALLVSSMSIVFGLLGLSGHGMILSSLLGAIIALLFLCFAYREVLQQVNWLELRKIIFLAVKHKAYPLVNAPSSFLDGMLLSLPVFFLTKYFPEAIVGYYALLTRVAAAPLSVVSGAVSQVHLKKIADLIHDGGDGAQYLKKITKVMCLIVLGPVIIFMLAAPSLFAFLFGESWRQAGELLVILMPSIALRFVVSPLSGTLLATGHVLLGSSWQVLAFIVTLLMFLFIAPTASVTEIFFAILITDLLLYAVYYLFIYYAVRKSRVTR